MNNLHFVDSLPLKAALLRFHNGTKILGKYHRYGNYLSKFANNLIKNVESSKYHSRCSESITCSVFASLALVRHRLWLFGIFAKWHRKSYRVRLWPKIHRRNCVFQLRMAQIDRFASVGHWLHQWSVQGETLAAPENIWNWFNTPFAILAHWNNMKIIWMVWNIFWQVIFRHKSPLIFEGKAPCQLSIDVHRWWHLQ